MGDAIMKRSEYIQRISKLTKEIRSLQISPKKHKWNKIPDILPKKEFLNGDSVTALNITITPTGCEWASHGGCTFCGEFSGSLHGKLVKPEFHIAQFSFAVSEYIPKIKPKWIRIYNEGSFLNDREIDPSAQQTILKLALSIEEIQRVTIETRAIYITQEKLEILKKMMRNTKELEIAVGLETQDEFIRLVCVNKGETNEIFEEKIKLLKDYGFKTLAYIIIKPPFLTEGEALEEAEKSVKYAFDIGFDAVSIEPMSIHDYSLVEALFSQGLYKLPWLWTVLQVVKDTHHLGEVRIGGLEYYPRPEIVAHNYTEDGRICRCTDKIWRAISIYNALHDVSIFDLLSCECKNLWEKIINQQAEESLEDRISNILAKFSLERYKEYKTTKGR